MSNIELLTDDKLRYYFFPNSSGFMQFRVTAAHDARVALSSKAAEADPMYEILIGGWSNTKSIIRKNRTKPNVAEASTPDILNDNESRGFWIRWNEGSVTVGRERESDPFLSWDDSEPFPIRYMGVCTARKAAGNWIIQTPQTVEGQRGPQGQVGEQIWVAASRGEVPASGYAGGEENRESLYVIRANFKDGLLPGKLAPSHGQAYVVWGGVEKIVQNYEVLCDFSGQWLATSRENIPGNAVPAGQTEYGETLFIGRVIHDDSLIVGKVQPSQGVLFISYRGKQLTFTDYEVLCS